MSEQSKDRSEAGVPGANGRGAAAALIVVDLAAFAGVWLLAWTIRAQYGAAAARPINEIRFYIHALAPLLPLWVAITAYGRHYQLRGRIDSLNETGAILRTTLMLWIGTMAAAYLVRGLSLGRSVITLAALGMGLYLWASRSLLRFYKRGRAERGEGRVRAAIVGHGETGRLAAAHLAAHPDVVYELVGFIASGTEGESGDRPPGAPREAVLGPTERLEELIREHRLEEIFLADPAMRAGEAMTLVHSCERASADFKFVTRDFLHVVQNWLKVDEIGEHSVMLIRNGAIPPMNAALKRAMDLAIAVPAAVLAMPLALLIAAAIRLDSPGPVFFVHERIGRDGRRFNIVKFRTMRADTDPYAPGPDSTADPRITRVGRWLRRTSLDELPQLINVIRGEMSLVGPRPEMPFIVEGYTPWQRRRLDVPQGITGLWQIAGRKRLPLQSNMEYDFYYIRNRSIVFDCAILLRTIGAVFFGRGAF